MADVAARLSGAGYLPDGQIATTVFLADRLGKPLMFEGPVDRSSGNGAQLAEFVATL